MTYNPLPRPESTMAERIDALKVAKPLVTNSEIFKSGRVDVLDLLRVAEYITTGHDYLDTHTEEEEAEEEPERATVSVSIDPKFDIDATAERIARRFNLGGLGNV